ncbi:hypothetical protein EVAR_47922_1 [Eumeta japonica]|uniref:Uncharacterized protein n=1 Tax=Eumeta variegata TaxID=151549 RepID=A0A4C1Y7J4_EUMVA|nr:hypothetical protein EVAR_47922_1 [Eumeta japonica]
MYGSENCVWQKKNESRINAVEIRSLRSMCGVSRKDRCRKSDVRERCGLQEDVVTRVERGSINLTSCGPPTSTGNEVGEVGPPTSKLQSSGGRQRKALRCLMDDRSRRSSAADGPYVTVGISRRCRAGIRKKCVVRQSGGRKTFTPGVEHLDPVELWHATCVDKNKSFEENLIVTC